MVWGFCDNYACKFLTSENVVVVSCRGHKVVKSDKIFKINNNRFWNIFTKTTPETISVILNCSVFWFWSRQTKGPKKSYFCPGSSFLVFFLKGWKLVNMLNNDCSMQSGLIFVLQSIFDTNYAGQKVSILTEIWG